MAAALLAEQPGELLLCGTSMGGMLALEVVRQAPQRVKALALLASSARPDTPELIQLRSDAIELFEQGRMREVLQANVAFAFDPAHAQALAPRYLAMMDRAGAAPADRAEPRHHGAAPTCGRCCRSIACPTLVVVRRIRSADAAGACAGNGDADSRRAPGNSAAMWAPAHLGAAAARERATARLAREPLTARRRAPRARRAG